MIERLGSRRNAGCKAIKTVEPVEPTAKELELAVKELAELMDQYRTAKKAELVAELEMAVKDLELEMAELETHIPYTG